MNLTSFASPYTAPGALTQVDSRKTVQPTPAPTPELSPTAGVVGQKYQGSNAPVLDWNTFEQQMLQPMLAGSRPNYDARGTWAPQLGLDIGGKGVGEIEGFDWGSFANGTPTGNLDDTGMPMYTENPNAQADRLAAYQKAIADPNTIYDVWGDAINPDGTTSGGRDYSKTQYKRVGDQLIPINTFNGQSASLTSSALKGALALAGATYGLGGFDQFLGGTEALSGMDLAADAAMGSGNNILTAGSMLGDAGIAGTGIPQFQQLPGYGNDVATLADASGGSPFTGEEFIDPYGAGSGWGGDTMSNMGLGAEDAVGGGMLDPYGAGSGWGNDTLGAMGATNDTAAGWLDTLKGYGSSATNWLGNLMSGDKTALAQARMGMGAIGLLGQLLQGNGPRNQLSPGQLSAAVASPYNKWTSGNQAARDKFAGTDLAAFTFAPPKLAHGGRAPHAAGCGCTMCSGGAVSGYARGSLVQGEGGGQDDMVPARLSPGEYVMDADTVSALGDGDNGAGADALDRMRENIRTHKRSAPAHKIPPKAHTPEHYLHAHKKAR